MLYTGNGDVDVGVVSVRPTALSARFEAWAAARRLAVASVNRRQQLVAGDAGQRQIVLGAAS
jgi:hypothetical protein